MTNEAILSAISKLPKSTKKALLKSITELHETAYRRGFQQGASYLLNFRKELPNSTKYDKIISWRYSRRKVANSPIHPKVACASFETLESIMLYCADDYINELKK